ncbi:unnamed protein product, partial [Effrenium voratum]
MDGWSRAAACGKLLVALYVLHKLPRLLRYWPARPLGPRAFAPGAGPPFLRWSACRLAEAIRRRELTAEQVVDAFIQRLQDVDVHLNALVAERFDAARQQAREVDRRIASEKGELPPFLGVPIVVKEAFEYPGFPYTNGLLSRKGRLGVKAGYAVQRVEAAGFLVLATTNISEACMWMESYNLVYGRVASPFGSHLSPGGSSGGSAALVAALGVPVGLTADIGGSTRIPALLNGLFGHKPTGGIIPNHGTHLEEFHGAVCRICQMGAVARHAEDLAPLLRIMAGPPSPEARLAHEYRACPVWRGLEPELGSMTVGSLSFRGGLPSAQELMISSVGKGQQRAQQRVIHWLETQGCKIQPLFFEDLAVGEWFDCWSTRVQGAGTARFREVLCQSKDCFGPAEVLRYLAGYSPHTFPALGLAFLEDLVESFSPPMEQRLARAQQLEDLLRSQLAQCQVLIMPTLPRHGLVHDEPLLRVLDSCFTSIWMLCSNSVRQQPTMGWDSFL